MVLLLVPAILYTIILLITALNFLDVLPKLITVKTIDPEIINGLLTIAGILFAFQAVFVRRPERFIPKMVFTILLFLEIFMLGISGFSFVINISDSGTSTVATLFYAFIAFANGLVITFFFILYDLFVRSPTGSQN